MSNPTDGHALPLAGVRVLELGSLIAGPYASAPVRAVRRRGHQDRAARARRPLRKWRKLHKGTSLWWYTQSRNKKSVTLDLKQPEAREIVRRLATTCDIVDREFPPGHTREMGTGVGGPLRGQSQPDHGAHLRLRPDGAVPGPTGLRRDRRVHGRAALRHRLSGPAARARGREPGRYARIALRNDRRADGDAPPQGHGGKGQFIDVALYEAVFAIMESLVPEYARLRPCPRALRVQAFPASHRRTRIAAATARTS